MLQENNNCVIDTEMRDIMGKSVYIAEKPSVAQEFAKALHVNFTRKDGYLEGGDHIVTWCVGHLVTMSYPDAYDPNLKRWSFDTLPFIPKEFKYEVIPAVAKQFNIVKDILTRDDVEYIYVCTDSGREGEYIYRLVRQEAGVKGKKERRVWIDSQTEEEILKGINTAKDISEYDNLSDSAYLRAKEDYLMGINFSRVLTLKYGRNIANYLHLDRAVVSVGRVMTCVLGMVVRREREIRSFVKTPFYRVIGQAQAENSTFDAEWRVSDKSMYAGTPYLYKDNGFKDREKAEELVNFLSDPLPAQGTKFSSSPDPYIFKVYSGCFFEKILNACNITSNRFCLLSILPTDTTVFSCSSYGTLGTVPLIKIGLGITLPRFCSLFP